MKQNNMRWLLLIALLGILLISGCATELEEDAAKKYDLSTLKGENVPGKVPLLDIDIVISKDDRVMANKIVKNFGYPNSYSGRGGNYNLVVVDKDDNILWNQGFELYFTSIGLIEAGKEYPVKEFDADGFGPAIPYSEDMHKLMIFKVIVDEEKLKAMEDLKKIDENQFLSYKLIYSIILNFCNSDGICGVTENYGSCQVDCPIHISDNVCNTNKDGVCDPDCALDVDPDCCIDSECCKEAGGEWKGRSDSCDVCKDRIRSWGCSEASTYNCDCGPDKCWNGQTCEPN